MTIYSFILSTVLTISSCGIFNTTNNSSSISGENYQEESITNNTSQPKEKKATKNKKKKEQHSESNNSTHEMILSSSILNGKWVVYSAKDKTTAGDERPYLIFDEATKAMYANNGCNTLNAEYKLNNSYIEFSNVLSTQRYCHDAQYELEINDAIANVKYIKINEKGSEYYLTFYNSTNQPLMVLRKPNLEFINGTWKITKVNSTHCKNKNFELALDLEDLKVHGRVGCNIVNGSLLLDASKPNSIMFLDLISTMMSCPDLAIESEILIALEKAESYKKSKDNKTLTLYDKDNNAVLELLNTTEKYSQK